MSLLGSAFGRALSGAGGAAASIADKYLDEELARSRAEALADLQRRTAGAIRKDQAAFDDERAPVLRQRAADDAKAAATTQDDITIGRLNNPILTEAMRRAEDQKAADAARRKIDGEKTELRDTDLQVMRRQKASDDAAATAEVQRRVTKESAADTDFLKAKTAIELSDPKVKAQIEQARAAAAASYAAAANSNANREGQLLANAAVKRVQALTDEMLRVVDDKALTPEQRAQKLGELQSKLAVLAPKKDDKTAGPTEEVVEERDDKGNVTSTKRTVKGPLGSTAARPDANDPAARLRAGIEKARSDGKIGEAIAELRKMGASPAQILQAGVTEDELKSASQPNRKPAAQQAQRQATGDPLAGLTRQQARDKRAELEAELSRWQGKPGSERRVNELQTLIKRLDNGQY